MLITLGRVYYSTCSLDTGGRLFESNRVAKYILFIMINFLIIYGGGIMENIKFETILGNITLETALPIDNTRSSLVRAPALDTPSVCKVH